MAPFVFRSRLNWPRAARSMLIYLIYSGVYATLMALFLELGVPKVIAPAAVIVVAAPMLYIAGRRWVRDPSIDSSDAL